LRMTVMLFLVKTFLGEKGSERRCIVMMQQPVLLSPKLFYIFCINLEKGTSLYLYWRWKLKYQFWTIYEYLP
jgi:hypothetical protein